MTNGTHKNEPWKESLSYWMQFEGDLTTAAENDRTALDKIIVLHTLEVDPDDGDRFCRGCFNPWPCETRKILDQWGRA